jgi:hypothetical protein
VEIGVADGVTKTGAGVRRSGVTETEWETGAGVTEIGIAVSAGLRFQLGLRLVGPVGIVLSRK